MRRPHRPRTVVLAVALSLSLALGGCAFGPPIGGLGAVSPGLWPAGVALEALTLLPFYGSPEAFGPVSAPYVALVATATALVAMDLASRTPVHDWPGAAGPLFGALALVRPDLAGSVLRAVLYGYGLSGLSRWAATDADPDMTAMDVVTGDVVYDATAAANDPGANELAFVLPEVGVQIHRFDLDVDAFEPYQTLSAASFSGELVSAFLPVNVPYDDLDTEDPAPALVVARDVDSSVYVAPRDGGAPMLAMNVGLDARKLRCVHTGTAVGYLCGISVFGEDRVALLTWDGLGMPVDRGSVDVGDGVVGIDLKSLGSGRFGLLSTGFNDGTYTETELSATADVVSSQTFAVPDGCEGSGHAIYHADDVSPLVVGTCYTSGEIFALRSTFDF